MEGWRLTAARADPICTISANAASRPRSARTWYTHSAPDPAPPGKTRAHIDATSSTRSQACHHSGRSRAFSSRGGRRRPGDFAWPKRAEWPKHPATREETAIMMPSQPVAEFGIADARRILGEVFAPWVQDL